MKLSPAQRNWLLALRDKGTLERPNKVGFCTMQKGWTEWHRDENGNINGEKLTTLGRQIIETELGETDMNISLEQLTEIKKGIQTALTEAQAKLSACSDKKLFINAVSVEFATHTRAGEVDQVMLTDLQLKIVGSNNLEIRI